MPLLSYEGLTPGQMLILGLITEITVSEIPEITWNILEHSVFNSVTVATVVKKAAFL